MKKNARWPENLPAQNAKISKNCRNNMATFPYIRIKGVGE
jgi:hypothetical protein